MHIIGGLYRNRILTTPKGEETRPTSSRLREALFNICQSYVQNARFLDLFAGSGAMGLEALSRGAQSATLIDLSKEAVHCMHKNAESLGVEDRTHILKGDVFFWLEKLTKEGQTFDIIYADPPYYVSSKSKDSSLGQRILHYIDTHSLLTEGGDLFIEEAKGAFPPEETLQNLELRRERPMGRAILRHYVKIKESER